MVVVIAGGAFYAGTSYGKSQIPVSTRGMNSGGRNRGGFTTGQIISKDATGIVIQMQDGSTKIVLVGGSTKVLKAVSGSVDDLSVGTNIMITGSTNSDGSVTAQSIQIRPAETGSTTPRQ